MQVINFNEYLDEKNCEIINEVYHYTSPEALIEIVNKGSIRFSNCLYLNDIEEYNEYILGIMDEIIGKEDNEISRFLSFMQEEMDKENKFFYLTPKNNRYYSFNDGNNYVFCCSTIEDSLSMWKYYTKEKNYLGYSIGIDIDKFTNGFSLYKGVLYHGLVIYEREKQIEIVKNFVSYLMKYFDDRIEFCDDGMLADEIQNNFIEFIQIVRLFFKRENFSDEKEYRFVVLTNEQVIEDKFEKTCSDKFNECKNYEKLNIGFTSVNGIIKSYIDVKLSDGIPINSIMLSPSIEEKIGKTGVEVLLSKNNYNIEEDKIKKSEIKLRY